MGIILFMPLYSHHSLFSTTKAERTRSRVHQFFCSWIRDGGVMQRSTKHHQKAKSLKIAQAFNTRIRHGNNNPCAALVPIDFRS